MNGNEHAKEGTKPTDKIKADLILASEHLKLERGISEMSPRKSSGLNRQSNPRKQTFIKLAK